jgi:NAD(P)-dependent dehydrogenase (short-subunit alcohol dehydrogenase family)
MTNAAPNGLATSTVVITGGGSGIGAACARAFLDAGARVGVLDLDPGEWADMDVRPVVADVTDQDSLDTAMRKVADAFGAIDVLVNNAGISAVGTVEDNDDDEWHRVLDVNLIGMVRATKAALPYLRRSARAAIVNVSSVAATAGLPNRVLYSASKGAVHAMTLALAADLVGEGIRVNCVAPGTADTPWVARLLSRTDDPEGERRRLEARQPIGRLVSADEVASAVRSLADPRSGATTGVSLPVDGGMSGLRMPAHPQSG